VAVDELLEHVPPNPEGSLPEILPPRVEAVEGNQGGRRGGLVFRLGADPLEVRDELAVEDRDLAVKQERRRLERRDRGRQLGGTGA
jgi:hypothetical protein